MQRCCYGPDISQCDSIWCWKLLSPESPRAWLPAYRWAKALLHKMVRQPLFWLTKAGTNMLSQHSETHSFPREGWHRLLHQRWRRQRLAATVPLHSYCLTGSCHDYTGCISSEAPRNHLLLTHILVQRASPSADGEGESALGHHNKAPLPLHHKCLLCGNLSLPERDCHNSQFFCHGCWGSSSSVIYWSYKTLTFPLFFFNVINFSVIQGSPPSTQVFHSQCGSYETP